MFGRVTIVALFAIFAIFPTPGDANEDLPLPTINAKWSSYDTDPNLINSYFILPQTYEAALAQGWTYVEGAITRDGYDGLVYGNDPRLTLIFTSSTGYLYGVQVAFLVSDVAHLSDIVDYSIMSGILKKTINGDDYWTAAFCFDINEDGVYQFMYREGDVLIDIPTTVDAIEEECLFSIQACLNERGTYYSQITADTTAANLFPWQLTVVNGYVVGLWFLAVGQSTPPCGSTREWFEIISGCDIQAALPDASECLINTFNEYGALSINFWLYEDPLSISCEEPDCS